MSERQRAQSGVRAGPLWPALIRIVLYTTIGLAVFTATFVVLTASAVVSRIARRCVWWWQLAGLRRRLVIAMVLSYVAASVAVDSGLTLPQDAAAAGAGLAGVALFGGWLWLDKRRGQREWKERRVQVVDGGAEGGSHLDEAVAQQEQQATQAQVDHARLELLETKVRDLFALMAQQTDGVMPTWPDHATTEEFPKLRLLQHEPPEHAGSA